MTPWTVNFTLAKAIRAGMLARERKPGMSYVVKELSDEVSFFTAQFYWEKSQFPKSLLQDMVIDRAGKHLDPRTMEFRALLKVVKNEKKKMRTQLRAAAVAEKRAARIAANERVK